MGKNSEIKALSMSGLCAKERVKSFDSFYSKLFPTKMSNEVLVTTETKELF